MTLSTRQERIFRNLAAMPTDDLQPADYAMLDQLVAQAGEEVERIDRASARKGNRVSKRPGREDWWTLPAAKRAVHQRSGGDCELRGPNCQGRAREVDHVYGRRGDDPHNPSKLLHVCGHGNFGGGCHQWVHQTAEGREASRVRAREIAEIEGYQ